MKTEAMSAAVNNRARHATRVFRLALPSRRRHGKFLACDGRGCGCFCRQAVSDGECCAWFQVNHRS